MQGKFFIFFKFLFKGEEGGLNPLLWECHFGYKRDGSGMELAFYSLLGEYVG